jgi:hypothetical protein
MRKGGIGTACQIFTPFPQKKEPHWSYLSRKPPKPRPPKPPKPPKLPDKFAKLRRTLRSMGMSEADVQATIQKAKAELEANSIAKV